METKTLDKSISKDKRCSERNLETKKVITAREEVNSYI